MEKITTTEIRALVARARQADQMALAGILCCVGGAMAMQSELSLLSHMDSFSRQQLELIGALKKLDQSDHRYRPSES